MQCNAGGDAVHVYMHACLNCSGQVCKYAHVCRYVDIQVVRIQTFVHTLMQMHACILCRLSWICTIMINCRCINYVGHGHASKAQTSTSI